MDREQREQWIEFIREMVHRLRDEVLQETITRLHPLCVELKLTPYQVDRVAMVVAPLVIDTIIKAFTMFNEIHEETNR